MKTTEKNIQQKIAEAMWHKDECFTIIYSENGAGITIFMRDGSEFNVVITKR